MIQLLGEQETWVGCSSMPDDDGSFIELPAPTQCVLWEKPELVGERDRFDTVEELIDEKSSVAIGAQMPRMRAALFL